ncbi:MAG TPA: hypothetical protein VID93_10475, partial [Acidimicrobiales bacterium]
IVAYPVMTLFGIVVTANHYFFDAMGGLLTLGVGYVIGRGIFEWNERRTARAVGGPVEAAGPTP